VKRALLLALAVCAPELAQASQETQRFFYVRAWPDKLIKFDPDDDEVVGVLTNQKGVCHDTELLHDKKRLLQVTGQRSYVEVVDLEKFEVVDVHHFSEAGFVTRISEVREQPGGARWYVKLDRIELILDHYVLRDPQWLDYDVAEKKVGEKKLDELPKAIRRGARLSPDGTKWHVFGKDITVVDPKDFEELGKIEISKPQYTGLGAMSVQGEDLFGGRRPDAYRFLYTMRDPVNSKRSILGMVDIDLNTNRVSNFRELCASPPVWGWRVTKDLRYAIGQMSEGRGGGQEGQAQGRDPETVLYTLDLSSGKKVRETRLTLRNGLHLSAVAPDGSKLYFAGRGHEIVVYDDEHRYLKTVELPGESDGSMVAVDH
jgi:hypothetical protein